MNGKTIQLKFHSETSNFKKYNDVHPKLDNVEKFQFIFDKGKFLLKTLVNMKSIYPLLDKNV